MRIVVRQPGLGLGIDGAKDHARFLGAWRRQERSAAVQAHGTTFRMVALFQERPPRAARNGTILGRETQPAVVAGEKKGSWSWAGGDLGSPGPLSL